MRLVLFLLVAVSIYSALHCYAFVKIRGALSLAPGVSLLLVVFMAFMVWTPILVRLLEKSGHVSLVRALAYVGFTWMGILFIFNCAYLSLDLGHLFIRAMGRIGLLNPSALVPSSKQAFFAIFVLTLGATLYGFFEARQVRTERIIIHTTKVPQKLRHVRIVQISDVHLGVLVQKERLQAVLEKIRKADADLLVSTGDLCDGHLDQPDVFAHMMSRVKTRYGKFAVTGNHESYMGLKKALAFTEEAGFRVLRDEGVTIAGFLNVAGVDDPAVKAHNLSQGNPEGALLSSLPKSAFTLLLKHRPVISEPSIGLFDLQLSGHVHGGQIFPFNLFTRLAYGRGTGLWPIAQKAYLYVSRGTGTWGPPIRILAPPEVTVIDLVHG